ncbi:MAG: enoyl-CoA hydratase-related protein [Ginsengibacter sp.]|jgi:2-(1,2-epoxy-1,2-dihydrophenyl)acetyl-CoA isomerase
MDSIQFEIKNSIAWIYLNRPEKYNAFNREMALALQERLEQCETNISIRCVVILGNGKAFSAGQDLAEVVSEDGPTMKQILSEHYNPIIRKIRYLNKPVIAAVNGVAAGAGANIALCCDIVLATESASFIQAFSKIGLIPDSGGTYFLPRLVGMQKATALMMTGEKVKAVDAEKMGMIYRSFPDEIFLLEVEKMAGILAQMPTKGLAFTKQALNLSLENSLEQQLNTEDQYQQKAATTNDFQEGVNSFIEKRKPEFRGD